MNDVPSAPQPVRTFQVDQLPVRVHASQENLSRDAAALVQSFLKERLAERGSAACILATGNSQIRFLDHLIALGGVDWSRITLFHMDEYLGIDGNHTASFRRYMRERVEQKVKPQAFHYLEGDAPLPLTECARYADLLQAQPIDLCCMGVGENGHLAFNDPAVADFKDPWAVKLVQLDVACREQQVREGHFPNVPTVPQYAYTLTLPTLVQAEKIVCISPETRKAAAIKAALHGPISTECPASLLREQSHAVLLLDTDSASLL